MTTFRTPTRIAPSLAAAFIPGRRTVVHLAPDQGMATLSLDEEAWADLGGVPAFGDGRVLSVFDYASTWTWWERHPGGEEFVLVLSGCVRFHLDDGASWGWRCRAERPHWCPAARGTGPRSWSLPACCSSPRRRHRRNIVTREARWLR